MKTRNLVHAALCAGIIAICSQLTIPTPLVPFSLQVFAVVLTALILPLPNALSSILIYILIGLIGLPVFAGGTGGLMSFFKPSFGFVIGFIPLVLSITYFRKDSKLSLMTAVLLGMTCLYLIGLSYLYLILTQVLNFEVPSLSQFLMIYYVRYIPTDLFQISLAYLIARRLKGVQFKTK